MVHYLSLCANINHVGLLIFLSRAPTHVPGWRMLPRFRRYRGNELPRAAQTKSAESKTHQTTFGGGGVLGSNKLLKGMKYQGSKIKHTRQIELITSRIKQFKGFWTNRNLTYENFYIHKRHFNV